MEGTLLPSFPTVAWTVGDRPLKSKLDDMILRDEYVDDLIKNVHDHDGTNGSLLGSGRDGGGTNKVRGGTRFESFVTATKVTNGSSADFYLTDNLLGTGNNIFSTTREPQVVVERSDSAVVSTSPTAHSWEIDGVGHDSTGVNMTASGNTGNTDYWSELLQDGSSKWYVRIHNRCGADRHFLVTARGD